jgi:glycosyltransferase involved in cell wall biosynthesis
MVRVVVLMSTWNGALYLREQIDSILSQTNCGYIFLLIRDDGSSDNTVEIIKSYKDQRITLIEGRNLGPKASFFELLTLAQTIQADFYALADQDDVWGERKIFSAIKLIGEVQLPTFYCSSLELVDQSLVHLSNYSHIGNKSFASTLLRNFATGCTCVFNKSFLVKLKFPKDSAQILMHDWWLAAFATAFCNVIYDENSYIKYRQHSSNHVGMSIGLRAGVSRVIRLLMGQSGPSRYTQALSLYNACAEFPNEKTHEIILRFLKCYAKLSTRIGFVCAEHKNLNLITAARFVLFG